MDEERTSGAAARMQAALHYIDEQGSFLIGDHDYTESALFTGRKVIAHSLEFTVIRSFRCPEGFVGDPEIAAKLFAVSVTGELLEGWGYRNGTFRCYEVSPPSRSEEPSP